jgi:hypothetical protein
MAAWEQEVSGISRSYPARAIYNHHMALTLLRVSLETRERR